MDDERDISYLLNRGLSQLGFEVDAFLDPTEALAYFRPGHYEGIIVDIRMPKMSGFELARKIWEKDAQARICFLTSYEIYRQELGWVSPHVESACFLVKPMSIADIIRHLGQHGIHPPVRESEEQINSRD